MGSNKICVSLGTNDVSVLKMMVNESLNNNTDYLEIRFDFFDKAALNDALEIVLDHKDRSVFTCRSPKEGGKYNGTEADRVTMLRRLAAFRPMLLDVEYCTMKENEDLLDQFTALNCDILVSWHNFEDMPDRNELANMMNMMRVYSNNIKIVCTAKTIDDSISILKLYEHAKIGGTNLIAFCMGEHGILSRVLCTYAGAPFTYASLTGALAPGQLTIRQMLAIYDRLSEKAELSNYDVWKNWNDFSELLNIIHEASRLHLGND
ncbi:MAG: type I 3-dehydroquinate dehydratase [Nitrososphaerales archaeon]